MAAQSTIRALNLYYAREPALRDQVLATRLRASDVRAEIGIPRGRVFRRIEGHAELPDVMWDCPFVDAAGHEHDMAARAASAEFEAVRARMRSMLRRFGRVLYQVVRGSETRAPDVVGTRIAQVWLQRVGTAPIEADRVCNAIGHVTDPTAVSLLRQHGDDVSLPDWIVELPGSGHDAIRQSMAAAFPGGQALFSVWEARR